MDGGNGQVFTAGPESIFVSSPGQREFLTFGRDPVRRSSVGVTLNIAVNGPSVRVVSGALELLLDLRFFTGGIIRSSVTIIEFSFLNRYLHSNLAV